LPQPQVEREVEDVSVGESRGWRLSGSAQGNGQRGKAQLGVTTPQIYAFHLKRCDRVVSHVLTHLGMGREP